MTWIGGGCEWGQAASILIVSLKCPATSAVQSLLGRDQHHMPGTVISIQENQRAVGLVQSERQCFVADQFSQLNRAVSYQPLYGMSAGFRQSCDVFDCKAFFPHVYERR